tara:strand:+ start:1870 stop:2091 length:222 start_codon:yes stop_codon:yes gene_type:complete
MKLSKQEHEYVKQFANILKDEQIADELTRIRYSLNNEGGRVTIDQVRKSRYKQGINKKSGRGKCQVRRDKENE